MVFCLFVVIVRPVAVPSTPSTPSTPSPPTTPTTPTTPATPTQEKDKAYNRLLAVVEGERDGHLATFTEYTEDGAGGADEGQ